jgi:hypothetical protein
MDTKSLMVFRKEDDCRNPITGCPSQEETVGKPLSFAASTSGQMPGSTTSFRSVIDGDASSAAPESSRIQDDIAPRVLGHCQMLYHRAVSPEDGQSIVWYRAFLIDNIDLSLLPSDNRGGECYTVCGG